VGNDPNPSYHTTNDTVATNLTASYGFDIAQTAMATISAMALPTEACFDSAPVLTVNGGASLVDLQWSAVEGAESYRVYRSLQSCEGQWTEIAETAATAWTDEGATEPATYYYHVEAVDPDRFCVSPASACASATPTVYRANSVDATWEDSCSAGGPGDGNGIVEPGESVLLAVTLQNDGTDDLTELLGVLSTETAGVSVTDPAAEWPDLPLGASAQSRPDHFGLSVASQTDCGTLAQALIDVSYAEGTNQTEVHMPVGITEITPLLAEEFSTGIPPDWTVVDGGSGGGAAASWTTDNPGGRSISAPFEGAFAIADSDEAGSSAVLDEQLISPVFDASGCSGVLLEFSNQFRWYSGSGDERAEVDVTTDGSQWINVLSMEGGSDGYSSPNTKSIEIADSIASDPSTVQVRFHYYPADYDWWWAVDNISVECSFPVCTPCAGGAAPPGEAGVSPQLRLQRVSGQLVLDWGAPAGFCVATDYAIYHGELATLGSTGYSHDTSLTCAAGGLSFNIDEADPRLTGADYFLVVSHNDLQEGSYGRGLGNDERPQATAACAQARNLSTCGD